MKKTNRTNKTITVIFRSPGMKFQVRHYESLAKVHASLGNVPLRLTKVGSDMYIITRADAETNGESLNMCYSLTKGDTCYTCDFHGDVVVIGYNPKHERFISLTKAQINMFKNAQNQ